MVAKRLLLASLLLLPGLAAATGLRPVAPGDDTGLEAGEAYLVLAVDSDAPLASARLRRGDEFTDLGALAAGKHYALYIADAGRYAWRDVVNAAGEPQPLDLENFSFDLDAGELNYAGDLVYRSGVSGAEGVVLSNRATGALDWMSRAFPRIKKKHVFRYAGNVPDAFPAYAAALPAPAVERVAATPLPSEALPIDIATLWQPTRVQFARMNPSGTRVAVKRQDAASGEWRVELVDLRRNATTTLRRDAEAVAGMEWSADDTLLTTQGDAGEPQRVQLARVNANGVPAVIELPRAAVVVDTLPGDDEHLLLASENEGRWMVHKVDVSSQAAADAFRPRWSTRLNRGDANEVAWFADVRGELRVAMTLGEEGYVVARAGRDAAASAIGTGADAGFRPDGASADARLLYGVTDTGRAQRELVEFDVETRSTRTLFARAGLDVVAPIFDTRRRPIGVTHYLQGRLASEYFDPAHRALEAKVRARFPTQSVAVLDRSDDGRGLLLSVEGADMAPALYHFDAASGARELAQGVPELAGAAFAPTHVVNATARDGLAVESFLTLPAGKGRTPLVVMPHGGPIAVADRLHFNREVQFLASLGYAVLRVNFRGSDGYGRAFREAGHGNYGTGIEDDIDAAIGQAGAQFAQLDTGRMCMVGSSYGGYSALVSAARWPQRFRCAVSISGISDLSLMFSASDAGRSDEGRGLLRELIGDPVAKATALRAASPVYHAASITAPVMLVHGLEDTRVDPENLHRMQRALAAAGNAPVVLAFEGEGHGVEKPENVEALWRGVAGFLRQHLDAPRLVAAN